VSETAFTVRGIPKPQPRPKAELRRGQGGKMFPHIYTPSTGCAPWRKAVARAAGLRFADPIEGPIEVEITVYLVRPGRLNRKRDYEGPVLAPGAVGDVDNFAKAILDAINGIVFRDDAQVTDLIARKRYHAKGAAPGALIVVREADAVPVIFAEFAAEQTK